MHTRSKLLLAALTSALLLAAAVGSSSANRLSISETRFRVTYSPISFVPSFGSTVRCPITLEGSFHSRTSSKVANALSGFITSITVGTCEAGQARVNTESLPWHIQYVSFGGTLPTITSITQNTIRPSWEINGEIFGIRVKCRYTPATQTAINTREARGVITEHRAAGTNIMSETVGCPEGRIIGTAAIRTPGGASITVSLV